MGKFMLKVSGIHFTKVLVCTLLLILGDYETMYVNSINSCVILSLFNQFFRKYGPWYHVSL